MEPLVRLVRPHECGSSYSTQGSAYNFLELPITVFSNTLPAAKRKEIEDAVVAAGRRLSRPFEAFLLADQARAGFSIRLTGPELFEWFDRTKRIPHLCARWSGTRCRRQLPIIEYE